MKRHIKSSIDISSISKRVDGFENTMLGLGFTEVDTDKYIAKDAYNDTEIIMVYGNDFNSGVVGIWVTAENTSNLEKYIDVFIDSDSPSGMVYDIEDYTIDAINNGKKEDYEDFEGWEQLCRFLF